MAWLQDGERIASGFSDRTIKLWERLPGPRLTKLDEEDDDEHAPHVESNGKRTRPATCNQQANQGPSLFKRKFPLDADWSPRKLLTHRRGEAYCRAFLCPHAAAIGRQPRAEAVQPSNNRAIIGREGWSASGPEAAEAELANRLLACNRQASSGMRASD